VVTQKKNFAARRDSLFERPLLEVTRRRRAGSTTIRTVVRTSRPPMMYLIAASRGSLKSTP
jgi:hypothetical protein